MDNTSDKKPLLSSNSSQVSGEGSNSKKDSKKDSKEESKSETKKESKSELENEAPPVSGGGETKKEARPTPHRIVRPTVQARPFSTRTKGLYWIFTILHLIVLLSVLFTISYGLLQFVFAQTKDGPLYWGEGSFIGGVPSIMFEPITPNATVIKNRKKIIFNNNSHVTYKDYVERLNLTMRRKEEEDSDLSETVHNCTREEGGHPWIGTKIDDRCYDNVTATLRTLQWDVVEKDPVCDPNRSPNLGYDKRTPCILIRLTKLRGFFPKSDKQDLTDQRPDKSEDPCKTMVKFNCTANHKESKTEPVILHNDGIPFCHFPFWNQKGYMPPYIMIRPENPLDVGETVITCEPALRSLKKLSNLRKNKVEIVVQIQE